MGYVLAVLGIVLMLGTFVINSPSKIEQASLRGMIGSCLLMGVGISLFVVGCGMVDPSAFQQTDPGYPDVLFWGWS